MDPQFYRPIAILCPLSKLLEKEFMTQMDKHMNKNKLWSNNIYSYRKAHNTTSALIDLMEVWMDNVNNNLQNITMFLDLSAGFDCVKHDTLSQKLELYSFSEDCRKLINSYLKERKQCVAVSGKKSELRDVTTGVPQGTVLGPLLFLVFINDMPNVVSSNIRLFADDALVYRSIHTHEDVVALQADLRPFVKSQFLSNSDRILQASKICL